MELYAKVLLITLAGIFILMVIEFAYGYFKGDLRFRLMDVVSSLSAGMTNVIKGVLGLTFVFFGYDFLYTHLAIVESEVTWVTYVLSFLALDFATYWYHRLAHHVNIFWNRHVIHHSGEDFNIPTALRQSISKFVNISVFFLIPAALIGLPPKIIAIVAPLHIYVQVWYHTTYIGKLGWLEYVIVTPAQHRVHHAINPIYRDKNLSPVFCIWDRLFGTFQDELEEEPCVYGVTRQVKTWNPIRINLNHIWLLIKDAWYAKSWLDKFRIWFMPTGWRPADVMERFPVTSADHTKFEKYDVDVSNSLRYWSLVQFLVLVLMTLHMLIRIVEIGVPAVFIYGAFMYVMVYSYTSLMDKDPNAIWMEAVKSIVGLYLIYSMGGWFGIDDIIPGGTIIVAAYQVASAGIVTYFVMKEIGWQKNEALEGLKS